MWKVHIIWWESINNVGIVANSGAAATFKITDAKRHVVAVTLLTEDNVKLTKQLNDRLKNLFIETNARWFLIKKEEPSNDNDTRHIIYHYMFLLMMMVIQIVKLKLILIKNILFQE